MLCICGVRCCKDPHRQCIVLFVGFSSKIFACMLWAGEFFLALLLVICYHCHVVGEAGFPLRQNNHHTQCITPYKHVFCHTIIQKIFAAKLLCVNFSFKKILEYTKIFLVFNYLLPVLKISCVFNFRSLWRL